MRQLTNLALLASALLSSAPFAYERVEPHPISHAVSRAGIVRVDANGCASKARRGSGFAWNSAGSIVTAFHVVAGCTGIGIHYPVAGGKYATAHVVRVLKSQDLALLSVDSPPNVAPLVASPTPPGPGATIVAWGYPVAVGGLLDTKLQRRQTTGRLDDLVNDSVRKQVKAVGTPSLDAQVLFLEGGELLPGHSGGPLVDANDQVVGIADGGLERGAVGISWAIPATELANLATSRESPTTASTNSDVLFAADVVNAADLGSFHVDVAQPRSVMAQYADRTVSYDCGSAHFVKVRTRSFADLYQSADDLRGLQQLTATAGNLLLPTDQYDIYQDVGSGATVVTPAGSVVRTSRGMCVVDILGSPPRVQLQQILRVVAVSSPAQAEVASQQYEAELTQAFGSGWVIDRAWSYNVPMYRPDGAIVRRKGSVQMVQTPYGPQPSKYALETLTAKGGHFLGVTAVRYDNTPQTVQFEQACGRGSPNPNCAQARATVRALMQMYVSTHLSAFPIG